MASLSLPFCQGFLSNSVFLMSMQTLTLRIFHVYEGLMGICTGTMHLSANYHGLCLDSGNNLLDSAKASKKSSRTSLEMRHPAHKEALEYADGLLRCSINLISSLSNYLGCEFFKVMHKWLHPVESSNVFFRDRTAGQPSNNRLLILG